MRCRLYVRWPKQKQFRPVNWRTGLQVGNVIHATLFTPEERARAEKDLQATAADNVGMAWDWRVA